MGDKVRGYLGAVVAAVCAVAGASLLGDSGWAKVLAVVAGCVLGLLLDLLLMRLRRRSEVVRKIFDRREFCVGTWLQYNVRDLSSPTPVPTRGFGIYVISYDESSDSYELEGRAYDATGQLEATWMSDGGFLFSKNLRRVSYLFTGRLEQVGGTDPFRQGTVELQLTSPGGRGGTGTVFHIALPFKRLFDLQQLSPAWMREHRYDTPLADLAALPTRDRFAKTHAGTLVTGG